MPYLKNTTKQDLVFPNGNIPLPAGKAVKVNDGDAELILKTWKFVEVVKGKVEEPKSDSTGRRKPAVRKVSTKKSK
jgi:hypothetical protein